MYTGLLSVKIRKHRGIGTYILVSLWCLGLLFGILSSFACREDSYVILASIGKPASPFAVFLINGLPLAITAFALYRSIHFLLYPLFFLNAFCRAFCATLALMLGGGGWLIRFLFLFSGSCTSVLMWWLIFCHINERGNRFFHDVYLVSFLSCGISLIEIFLISPLLRELSNYF